MSKKYDDLSHEEREIVLFIENNQQAYNKAINNPTIENIRYCTRLYKQEYAQAKDKIFTLDNINNVRFYLKQNKLT